MDPDEEPAFIEHPSRVRRAKALGALSLMVVAVACFAYLRPSLAPVQAPPLAGASRSATGYQLDAVDFVDRSTGWVLADLDNFQFTILGTTNAGRRWTTKLTAPSQRPGEYMRFFDRLSGVVVAIGPDPTIYSTTDGGTHWASRSTQGGRYALAASFVDALHGWLLEYTPSTDGLETTELLQTSDGGTSWRSLSTPAGGAVQAYAVSFTDRLNGWLDVVAAGPYAYRTGDGGASWQPVRLPTPPAGWPVPHGSFFVAARPTLGGGVIVTVVNSAHINGRNAAGTAVLSYPPLTVRTFDGGSPVEYVYSTFVDSATNGMLNVVGGTHRPGPAIQAQPANQIGFRSADGGSTWSSFAPPAPNGTIGFADALSWWWVGPGVDSQTTDGGLTWSPSHPDPVANPLPGSLILLSPREAWISALDDQGAVLFTTADAGRTWVEVRLPPITGS